MILEIPFTLPYTKCPMCGKKLISPKHYRRNVKQTMIAFIAVVETKKCTVHGRFRSDKLQSIVSKKCTYANDIMIDAAMKRFIDGRS